MDWIRFCDANNMEFSNFYVHKIPLVIDGKEYRTIEHYFQSQKYAKDIGKNLEFMQLIIDQSTPYKAKILASIPRKKVIWSWQKTLMDIREKYKNDIFFDKEWDNKRDDVMLKGLIAKFTQDEHCKEILLSTGNAILSEDSTDKYWGSGGNPNVVGKLGELLMIVRNKIG